MSSEQKHEFRTKSQIVFDEMRRRIVDGMLGPGARLRLKGIAEEFDCSEIPVREAFRSLAAVGLVDLIPHEGAHVSTLRADELVELTEVRALLEPEATATALPRIDAAECEALDMLVADMETAAAAGEGVTFGRLNRRFHARIVSHCPNRKLVALINDLWERAERGRAVFRSDPAHLQESVVQHRELMAAIRAGDTDALRMAATRHSRFGLDAVRRLASAREAAALAQVGAVS